MNMGWGGLAHFLYRTFSVVAKLDCRLVGATRVDIHTWSVYSKREDSIMYSTVLFPSPSLPKLHGTGRAGTSSRDLPGR